MHLWLSLISLLVFGQPAEAQAPMPFRNPDIPIEERVDDLMSRLTLEEKVAQLDAAAPAIPRLGIPAVHWRNECLHGAIGPSGTATVFPQIIGLAATWSPALVREVAEAISDEVRAKFNLGPAKDRSVPDGGLTMFSPNVNIFRDPRWGRGQETFGEDPYLVSRCGVAYVQGLQGKRGPYVKLIATAKHFVAHSGPELGRHAFDARVSQRDLRDTYLPAFRACVQEGGVRSVMCAYNRIDGTPCCANEMLLDRTLRDRWGFDGYVVTDCGAISDLSQSQKTVPNITQAVDVCYSAGCDLACGARGPQEGLLDAVQAGLLGPKEVDRALRRLLKARFRLGLFNPPDRMPFSDISADVVHSPAHRDLALKAARASIVLLKNNGVLPLARDIGSIAVVGPNADDAGCLLGNYHGRPAEYVTALRGIRETVGPDTHVLFEPGCNRVFRESVHPKNIQNPEKHLARALAISRQADVIVACVGLNAYWESEENDEQLKAPGFAGGDRTNIELPAVQRELLELLRSTNKPIVLVNFSGGAMGLEWADKYCAAVLQVWYPGEQGGRALADVLFGLSNPCGRLPVTFYRSVDQLPPFKSYAMEGRTYRYFKGDALYPFGFGLSYTRFEYENIVVETPKVRAGQSVKVEVTVRNVGARTGAEVVQLYLSPSVEDSNRPLRSLQAIQRIELKPNEEHGLAFEISGRQMSYIDGRNQRVIKPGMYDVWIGGQQPGQRTAAATTGGATARFEVTAPLVVLEPAWGSVTKSAW